jgi:hypothetical protein
MAILEEFPEEMDASGRKENFSSTATSRVITGVKASWNYWNYFSNFHLHSCFRSYAANKCYLNVALSSAHWITTNHLSIEWALVPHLSSGWPVFAVVNLIDEVAGCFKSKAGSAWPATPCNMGHIEHRPGAHEDKPWWRFPLQRLECKVAH